MTYFLIFIALCTSIFFVIALKPNSTSALVFFSLWLALPYIIMSAVLAIMQRRRKLTIHYLLIVFIVVIGGMLMLADIIFWHPDAQGAIAVLMVPIVQAGVLICLWPIANWWSQRKLDEIL